MQQQQQQHRNIESIFYYTDTGEIVDKQNIVIKTHEQIQKEKEIIEKKKIKELAKQQIRAEYKKFGHFSWILANAIQNKSVNISPTDLTKLMYLATYATYTNQLCFDNGVAIKKNNLKKIMKLNESQFNKFFNEMTAAGHLIFNGDALFLNDKICYRGTFNHKLEENRAVRLYHSGIRNLYDTCKVSSHRFLGYIFELLPLVNVKYNCVCQNIFETDLDKIICLSIGDVCDYLGYDRSNATRLKQILLKCKFSDGMRAVGMVVQSGGIGNWRLFVNPRLYYSGNAVEYEKAAILGKFLE